PPEAATARLRACSPPSAGPPEPAPTGTDPSVPASPRAPPPLRAAVSTRGVPAARGAAVHGSGAGTVGPGESADAFSRPARRSRAGAPTAPGSTSAEPRLHRTPICLISLGGSSITFGRSG